MSAISGFLNQVIKTHKTNSATEHSYRPAFVDLFNGLDDNVTALNEPRRIECGAPDFIIQRGKLVVGHLEAKDVGVDIRKLKGRDKEQQQRYLDALPNLIYSNGLDWDFYRDGELVESVSIASLDKTISPVASQYAKLESLLADFIVQTPISITRPKELAERMAGKAKLIKALFYNALADDLVSGIDSDLVVQFETFRDNLIHDIEPEGFADIYAETICYGMFAARLHDDTLDTFSRHEALDLLPKTNPFLRNLFTYVAGAGLDDRIAWIIDDLADIFRATDVAAIMAGFGKMTGREDPFLHFYETFLAAYNPSKRKARGVWYTPEPVVNFIVRAVDEVLQTEFGLADGLADTSKVQIEWDTGQVETTKKGKPKKHGMNAVIEKEVHRVQVLDPATGTGTFLAEVIKQIAPKIKGVAPGMWSGYIENDLIPRIHGFEILMASYAMCHMKLDMVLTDLGYKPSGSPPRQSVYLTNSLEAGEPPSYTLPFARWLSNEVKLANTIKRDMPIMCVIGNPPYNPSSKNSNPWINNLMQDYKEGVSDRKINLNDDYMKFIRFGEYLVEKNGAGVVAMITNNSFLDGTTQRGMRKRLMRSFNKIDVFNLHGDIRSSQKDKKDQNVFDITQGVSVTIFCRTSTSSECTVRYLDVLGSRLEKYKFLQDASTSASDIVELKPAAPYYFFVPKDLSRLPDDFSLDDFFEVKSSGIQTKNDEVAIQWTAQARDEIIDNFLKYSVSDLEKLFPSKKVWSTEMARKDFLSGNFEPRTITYRPFDIRYTVQTRRSGGFLGRPRYEVMRHIGESDVSLIVNKKHVGEYFSHVSIARSLVAHGVNYLGNRGQDFACPLYIVESDLTGARRPNFDPELYEKLRDMATHTELGVPDEVAVFDYIYGVLHCPKYRETYAESLKTDFPRIPWPSSPDEFWNVSAKGESLRKLHLMENDVVGETPFPFQGEGDNVVGKPAFNDGKVWVNKTQYFADVPGVAWSFYIGGYQPAQKWLNDRKGRALTFADVKHYQRIIKVLAETDHIMGDIVMTLDVGQ